MAPRQALGGQLVKSRLQSRLVSGSEADLKGLYLPACSQHVDLRTDLCHAADHTRSRTLYKGAVRDSGRSIYQGLVHVRPRATKAEGYLANRSLILNAGARADAIWRLDRHLGELCRQRLCAIPGVELCGCLAHRAAVVSFSCNGTHPHDVAQLLDMQAIAVRAGHHCAQPLVRKLGVQATVRASLYLHNTIADADRLAEGLGRAKHFLCC